jgi:UDP-2,3-diacylglucosamine hydrolase
VETIGLIAGMGNLPIRIAQEAMERGHKVVAICFPGFSNPAIADLKIEIVWVKLGQLDKMIESLKSRLVKKLVMAGKIEKHNMLKPWNIRPDRRCLKVVRSLKDWRDDTILAAIEEEFRKDGIIVDEITCWASKLMAPLGVLTKKAPTEKQWADVDFGRKMARGIGDLDIGQTVVVKNSAVICVEAIEGTDKAILRTRDLNVSHAVVVKMSKPSQDMRFDVPGIGPKTIESMISAKAKVLAIEAGKTMIADSEETIQSANSAKIIIVGIPAHGPLDNLITMTER